MTTLAQILSGPIEYSTSWGIYAQLVHGKFTTESNARFGQRLFENGGILDDCVFFSTNEWAVDGMEEWDDAAQVVDMANDLLADFPIVWD